MWQILPAAAILIAVSGSRPSERINAPVPKTPPVPSIHGNYLLLATSNGVTEAPFAGPGGGRGGFGGRSTSLRSLSVTTAISRSEIVIEGRGSTLSTTMEYTLEPSKSPITIDVESTSVRNKKTKLQGIVEINGNRLTIALAKEGGERPKTTDEADGVIVYYFQKAPPPPRIEYRIIAMTAGKEAAAEKELNKLVKEGYELVSTTNPIAPNATSSVTTIHFILKRTVKQP